MGIWYVFIGITLVVTVIGSIAAYVANSIGKID